MAMAMPVDFHDEGILSRWTQRQFFSPDAVIDLGGAARSAVALLHEAKTLAAVLRAGAMPARLQPLSESQLQPK